MKYHHKISGYSVQSEGEITVVVWWHNLKEHIKTLRVGYEPQYLIRCPHCKKVQLRADWDYQRCEKCDNYMYDYRGLTWMKK